MGATDVIVHGILDAALKVGTFALTSYVKSLEVANNNTELILSNATKTGLRGDVADLTEDLGESNATARTRIHSLD